MRYLADACALIVYSSSDEPDLDMPRASAIMRDDTIHVASITVWEITRKVALGQLVSIWGGHPSLASFLHFARYETHDLSWEDAEYANALPGYHKDPMDRLLIATAMRNDMTVLTSDRMFARYGVKTLW